MLKKALLYLFLVLMLSGMAQGRLRNFRQRELGFYAGASYYLGDINPRIHFLSSRPAGGVFFRYSTNYRYAFRFGLNYGSIAGSDSKSSEANQLERNLSFKSQIYELSSIAEFNFVEYRIGHDKHRFTMFIFAGLAGFYFNPKADVGNGYEALRNYHTEGQSKAYSRFQISMPFGVGLKWNVGKKCGLGIEWGPRRTFTDYLDDVSGTYPEFSKTRGIQYTSRTRDGVATPGSMRGNPSTRDWYFYYGFTLSIKLREAHKQCYKDF